LILLGRGGRRPLLVTGAKQQQQGGNQISHSGEISLWPKIKKGPLPKERPFPNRE
jgi:hypothetical protein